VSVLSPSEPRQDELELLIREARARQRKRWVGSAALVAVLAGAALGITSIVGGTTPKTPTGGGPQATGSASASRCGVRVKGVQILQGSRLVYREPISRTFGHQIECSGPTVWVVFFNGVASSQEGYFGVRSGDGGRSWKVVFAERYFNMKAPHQLDDYLAAWTIHGPRDAYFTGTCPACGYGTVSLWVTKDGGRTFRMYKVPALTGSEPTSVRVSGHEVTIRSGHRSVKVRVA
jgi:hypothetical protein